MSKRVKTIIIKNCRNWLSMNTKRNYFNFSYKEDRLDVFLGNYISSEVF